MLRERKDYDTKIPTYYSFVLFCSVRSNEARTNPFIYFTFLLFCYFLNGAPYFSKSMCRRAISLKFNAKRQSLAITGCANQANSEDS